MREAVSCQEGGGSKQSWSVLESYYVYERVWLKSFPWNYRFRNPIFTKKQFNPVFVKAYFTLTSYQINIQLYIYREIEYPIYFEYGK